MTRQEFEQALNEARLWIREYQAKGEKLYLVRRNGRTKTWKRDPNRWMIPIKWKLNNTAQVSEKLELGVFFKIQPGPNGPLVGEELLNKRTSEALDIVERDFG